MSRVLFFIFVVATIFSGCAKKDAAATTEAASGVLTYTVTLPINTRSIRVDDETAFRTVSFTHTGDLVECSSDGGTTFGACTSGSTLVWSVANYSATHIVRFSKTGAGSDSYQFIPSTLYPDVSFVSCSSTISTNSNFDTFETTMNASHNVVLCLANGLTITNSGGEGSLLTTKNNVTFIAREGDVVAFNAGAASTVFDLSNQSGIKFVGLVMLMNYQFSGQYGITMNGANNILLDNVTIQNVDTSGFNGPAMIRVVSGLDTTPMTVRYSTLNAGSGHAIYVQGATSRVNVSNSTLSGIASGVLVYGRVDLTGSTVSCTGTGSIGAPVRIYGGGRVDLTSSTVNDGCGNGAVLFSNGSSTVNISQSTVKRTAENASTTARVFVDGDGGGQTATGTGNLYCNVGPSPTFTAVATGTVTGTAVTGASVTTCP